MHSSKNIPMSPADRRMKHKALHVYTCNIHTSDSTWMQVARLRLATQSESKNIYGIMRSKLDGCTGTSIFGPLYNFFLMSHVSLAPSCWNCAQCSNFEVFFFYYQHTCETVFARSAVKFKLKKKKSIVAHKQWLQLLLRKDRTNNAAWRDEADQHCFFCLVSMPGKLTLPAG